MILQRLEAQLENLLVNFQPQALTNDRKGGVVGSAFLQFIPEKLANGDRISTAGGNGPLTGKIFKEADHDHLQINHRIHAGTANRGLLVGRSTELADLPGKIEGIEGLIEFGVEGRFG
jgi:hypothetical protein